MKFLRLLFFNLLMVAFAGGSALSAHARFEAGKGTFMLDGKPFVVKAAELHYPRIPAPYWDHRIKMAKALGMNTICLYVFWNIHEQKPGEFDFSGQNDLRKFISLCAENDMKVILRPGPYVCAEWEMGGLPWWLLKDKDIRLRENDPRFMQAVQRFEKEVADQVKDLTDANGGPIIMVQVENEYGSYGTDKEYVAAIRDCLRQNYGPDMTLFQCDWSSNFLNNGLDDLVWTLNFGTGADIDAEFAPLRKARPDSPLMCSEYWSGWFDKWGASHETRPADAMVAGIDSMLSKGISFSLYMTHGGTSFGHWAGANSPGYAPDVTSYDYDAPIDEAGNPTPKYHMLREVMAKHLAPGETLPPIPYPIYKPANVEPAIEYGIDKNGNEYCYDNSEEFPTVEIVANEFAPLGLYLPPTVRLCVDAENINIEEFGVGYGTVRYLTSLKKDYPAGTKLVIEKPHDYAQVFLNGEFIGKLDRRLAETTLVMPEIKEDDFLEIIVEATGRINFGRAIKDFKGIASEVLLDGEPLTSWVINILPDEYSAYSSMDFQPISPESYNLSDPEFDPRGAYRAKFTLTNDQLHDCYLYTGNWGKGTAFVNGHPLGRFWELGPQQSLYLPECWLRQGENELLYFDVTGGRSLRSRLEDHPTLNELGEDHLAPSGSHALQVPDGLEMPAEARYRTVCDNIIPNVGATQMFVPEKPVTAEFLIIEIDSTHDGAPASIAELNIEALDANGAKIQIPSDMWRFLPGSTMERAGNHTTDKLCDSQLSTYWQAENASNNPAKIVLWLGGKHKLSKIALINRMEKGHPGAPKHLRIKVAE